MAYTLQPSKPPEASPEAQAQAAERVRNAAKAFNEAANEALKQGLRVDVETYTSDITAFGGPRRIATTLLAEVLREV